MLRAEAVPIAFLNEWALAPEVREYLVDNIRTAHGREPFEGPREIVVAMADAGHLTDRSPTIELTAN